MWIPDESRLTGKFRYVEVAYAHAKHGVRREMAGENKPRFYHVDNLADFIRKHDNTGVYKSVWQYDRPSVDGNRLGPLYFDFDHGTDPNRSRADASALVDYFLRSGIPEDAINIWFTGKKGFHVEVEPIPLNISPKSDLAPIYRFIASRLGESLGLDTHDLQVYDNRRIWRMPNSKHQATGLYKIPLTVEELDMPIEQISSLAKQPREFQQVPQEFNPEAAAWFREWQHDYEFQEVPTEDYIERFLRLGSGSVSQFKDDSELEFDPKSLFENCHALRKLWDKAENEHHLEHEERLFLASILSYTEMGRETLHGILALCEDYNHYKTQAHIDDWLERKRKGIGGHPFSCRRANEAGIGCGNCDLEPKPKYERVGDKLVKTGEYSEPSPVRFAYRRPRKD